MKLLCPGILKELFDITTTENLLPQEEWDASYGGYELFVAPESDPIRIWINRHVSDQKRGSCLELGCFPGRFLAVFGEQGFELNGIDLTPRVERELPEWLRQRGFNVGQILRADLFEHKWSRTFDVVCSFGLIEHFLNWQELLRQHARLVAPGGLLLVSTPNFRGGLQGWIHRHFDSVNLEKHHLPAMDPPEWSRIASEEGLIDVENGGLGRFEFWIGGQTRSAPAKVFLKVLSRLQPFLRQVLPANDLRFAPYYGLAARRPVI